MGGGSDTKKSNPSDAAGRGWHYRLRGKGGGEPLVANGASEATELRSARSYRAISPGSSEDKRIRIVVVSANILRFQKSSAECRAVDKAEAADYNLIDS
jgi:hypothetical protein